MTVTIIDNYNCRHRYESSYKPAEWTWVSVEISKYVGWRIAL